MRPTDRLPSRTASRARAPRPLDREHRGLPGPEHICDNPHEFVGVGHGEPVHRRDHVPAADDLHALELGLDVPPRMPASAAGPPGVTRSTRAPRLAVRPRWRASDGVRSSVWTPAYA